MTQAFQAAVAPPLPGTNSGYAFQCAERDCALAYGDVAPQLGDARPTANGTEWSWGRHKDKRPLID
eukprot:2085366-Amphidinium_carterae.1